MLQAVIFDFSQALIKHMEIEPLVEKIKMAYD
jgi:hypothetical protein